MINLSFERVREVIVLLIDGSFHPIFFGSSPVQHECIPQAILGMDVICQAKSGMGKTAVFVLSTLQQIEPVAGQVAALVLCHTRELAYQVLASSEIDLMFTFINFVGISLKFFNAYLLRRYATSLRGSVYIYLISRLLCSMVA